MLVINARRTHFSAFVVRPNDGQIFEELWTVLHLLLNLYYTALSFFYFKRNVCCFISHKCNHLWATWLTRKKEFFTVKDLIAQRLETSLQESDFESEKECEKGRKRGVSTPHRLQLNTGFAPLPWKFMDLRVSASSLVRKDNRMIQHLLHI